MLWGFLPQLFETAVAAATSSEPLTIAPPPPTALKKLMKYCNKLGGLLTRTKTLLVSQYVTNNCYNDPAHFDVFDSWDFGEDFIDFLDQYRYLLGGWATSLGLNLLLISPTSVVNPKLGTNSLVHYFVTVSNDR
jgi:hypothetical protein